MYNLIEVISNEPNGCFESFLFRQNFVIFVRQITDFDGLIGIELPVSMYTTKTPIDMCRFTFDPQLKKILTFSVKDIYQLNYFICIKDFNAETNTSLKLNLFSFFKLFAAVSIIKGKLSAFMYIFLISDR